MAVTNPISANQVINVDINQRCLDIPCKTLPDTLQAIVDKVCENTDFTSLDFHCATPANNLLDTLQSILDVLQVSDCGASGGIAITDGTDLTLTGLTACSTDSWECNSRDACFDFTNACDPGVITVGLAMQILINRSVAYGNTIKTLCDRITDLENLVADQQLAITTIQTSCCP